jgi:hypothetical protein
MPSLSQRDLAMARRLSRPQIRAGRYAILALGILFIIAGGVALSTSAKLGDHINQTLLDTLIAWINGPRLSYTYQGVWVAAVQHLASSVLHFLAGAVMVFVYFYLGFVSRICVSATTSEQQNVRNER